MFYTRPSAKFAAAFVRVDGPSWSAHEIGPHPQLPLRADDEYSREKRPPTCCHASMICLGELDLRRQRLFHTGPYAQLRGPYAGHQKPKGAIHNPGAIG